MRGTTNDQIIHRDADENFIGVGLGSDFCAEHEWGTRGIKSKFGIPAARQGQPRFGQEIPFVDDLPLGIAKFIITQGQVFPFECTKKVVDYTPRPKDGKVTNRTEHKLKLYGLTSCPVTAHSLGDPKKRDWYLNECNIYYRENPDKRVYAAWDESNFMFMIESKKDRDEILKAFERKDIAIFLGGASVFNNGTFNILIRSRVPKSVVDTMESEDLDHRAMMRAFKETGIEKRLIDAKLNYYALAPRWANEEKKELSFWLNPADQQNVNFGWFSLQDLEDWIRGTGKIPKNPKAETNDIQKVEEQKGV